MPILNDEDEFFNNQYYTRDTRRNQAPMRITTDPTLPVIAMDNTEPMGSPGRNNPAVARYDPTLTRSAMTTTHKAMNALLAKRQPDHFPVPWYQRKQDVVKEAQEHAKANDIPQPIGVARSLGVARSENVW